MDSHTILYIHGMGGGGDSRIPSILNEWFSSHPLPGNAISVVVRTYSFDPQVAAGQIASWVEELEPDLVIGESLGALQALRIRNLPHLFVSPSLNAALYLGWLSPLASIPGVTAFLDWLYRPRPGDRQSLHFTREVLSRYTAHRKAALQASSPSGRGERDSYFAFFGTKDHYRRTGVVSIRTWRKYFGDASYAMYRGTHFMEEEYIMEMLIPKICETLGISIQ